MTGLRWDYIVVGGGHNGLVAGCTLAAAARSVLVLERRPEPGGLSTSLPLVPAAPRHLLSIGAMDDFFLSSTGLVQDLGLARHGYRSRPVDPSHGWINEDGDTLLLFRDFGQTLKEISYFSPQDAKAYRELRVTFDWLMDLQEWYAKRHPSALGPRRLIRAAIKLTTDKRVRRTLQKMLTLNVFEMIADSFESEPMRGLWGHWCSMAVPPDVDGTGIHLTALAGIHRGPGIERPVGGMSALVDALTATLRAHGGETRCGQDVRRILVDAGRAVGVELADGTCLYADRGVLSSCAPQVTLGRMLDDGILDRDQRIKVSLMPASSAGSGPFKIDIAVGGPVGYPAAELRRRSRDDVDFRGTTLLNGTLEDHIEHLAAMKAGKSVAVPPVYMTVLSAADDTLAPPGEDVVYLYSSVPVSPPEGWASCKAVHSGSIIQSAKRFLGGLDAEIGRVEHSPQDFERGFGAPAGCYFHLDMLPTRLGPNRPARGLGGYDTPVRGLYLAGSGSHPGGGVSGQPGRLAARHALSAESERRPHPDPGVAPERTAVASRNRGS